MVAGAGVKLAPRAANGGCFSGTNELALQNSPHTLQAPIAPTGDGPQRSTRHAAHRPARPTSRQAAVQMNQPDFYLTF